MSPELPLGEEIDWKGAKEPARTTLRGAHVLLRPVDPLRDAGPLYAVSHSPHGDETIWTYLPDGPYESPQQLRRMLASVESSEDPLFFTIEPDADRRPLGLCCYMRVEPHSGVIEIGHIWFGAPLKRTTAATEAIYLMARHAFDDLGYRRLEWKCNSLNAASRRAAERLGFSFEGIFHKHQVVKGRNRDTAWYAITDERWPVIRAAMQAWLSPENLGEDGLQRRSLADLRGEAPSPGPGLLA